MTKRIVGLLLVTALWVVPAQAEFWAISNLDLVLDVDTDSSPPRYWLRGFTFPDHDIAFEDLVVGESTGVVNVNDEAGRQDITLADNFDLNDFAPRNGANPDDIETLNFGGSPTWQDTNGPDKFDFFIFEAGANDEFTVQAVFPDGTLGQKVVVPSSTWTDTGPEPLPDIQRTPGPNNNQQIAGIAFKVTDLVDADGNPLANDAVIAGLHFKSGGMDPSCICAVRGTPFASGPEPADEALVSSVCPLLKWTQGMDAESEEVYFSPNLDDVVNLEASALFATVAVPAASICAPDSPYADGLGAGTYYWRIVTATTGGESKAGPIWSFTVIGATASDPMPVDAALYVNTDVTLTWTSGADAFFHNVHFGTSFEDVNSATEGAIPSTETSYVPGPLELGTTYYWRVDEFDGVTTHKGDVWSFTTVPAGEGGLKADYFTGEFFLFGDPVASRVDPQIDFNWNTAAPDPAVNRELFSVRWKGEIKVPADGTYTFITNSNDGSRIFVNDQLVVEDWGTHAARDAAGTVDLAAGDYSFAVEYMQQGGDATINVSWQSDRIARQVIPSVAFVPIVRARLLYPANGAASISQDPRLRWETASPDATHRVFLGQDPSVVETADVGTAGIYRGEQEATTFVATGLETGKPYYWRIDEVIPGDPLSPIKGKIWSFTVAQAFVVDDFENYIDEAPDRIFDVWEDGLTDAVHGGSVVGNEMAPFAEQEIVHSGNQSLSMTYDNSSASKSEATRTFAAPQNWTADDPTAVSLWFRGNAAPGSFSFDADAGRYTIGGSGNGVDETSDGFRFAYKTLTGDGTITALIEQIDRPNDWATASVMIRNTLEPGSVMATCGFRSTGQGFLRWRTTADAGLAGTEEEPPFPATFVLPHWFRLTRQGDSFTAEHSSDGATWEPIGNSVNVPMGQSVFVGLAASANAGDAARIVNTTVFSNVTVDGSVDAPGAFEDVADIGISANDPENFYVTINSSGGSATFDHPAGPDAIVTNDWTEWSIPADEIVAAGVNLGAVTGMTVGVGNPAAGGTGTLYVDDIRLLLPPVISVAAADAVETTGDNGMVLSINGIGVDDLVLGTTSTDFEKFADHPAVDADDFDLGSYASLDDSSFITMKFDVPVSTVFIIERGANDMGGIQPIDADGNPVGVAATYATSDWFKPGITINGQDAGAMVITAEVPIAGVTILPPEGGNMGLDPASVSGVPAQ